MAGRIRLHTCRGTLEVVQVATVEIDGVPLDLPRQQMRLLLALLESAEPLMTAALGERAWRGAFVMKHTIHSQLALLRKSIADLGLLVCNRRGHGYFITIIGHDGAPSELEPQIELR